MYIIHPLTLDLLLKYRESYFSTLDSLVESPVLDEHMTTIIFKRMVQQETQIFVAVHETAWIIWCITIFLEQKLIRGGALAAHLEEVVVRKGYESQGIGSALLKTALAHAFDHGCYKIVLECSDQLVPFYEKSGFKKSEVGMKLYL